MTQADIAPAEPEDVGHRRRKILEAFWPPGEEDTGPIIECSVHLGVSARVLLARAELSAVKPPFGELWEGDTHPVRHIS